MHVDETGVDFAFSFRMLNPLRRAIVIRVIWSLLLGAVTVSCSSTNDTQVCAGGCLCSTTPQDCPSGCYPTYQKTDGGSTFVCANFLPTDAATSRVPANHRLSGSMCPQGRSAGVSEIPASCLQSPSSLSIIPDCTQDSDCTAGINGRCLHGGGPACLYGCSYDDCSSDSDCSGNAPCACRASISDNGANTCATESNCRVDADCGPGGFCSPSLVNNACLCSSESFCAPGQGGCSETGPDGTTTQVQCLCSGSCGHGYFCHTPKDSCLDDGDCARGTCSFDQTSQTWMCSVCIGPL